MKNYFKITVFLALAAFSFEKIQGAAAAEGSGLPTLWDDPEIRSLTLQLSAELRGYNLECMERMMGALQRAFVPDGVIQNQQQILDTFSTIQILDFNVENVQRINVLFEKCLNHGLTVTTLVFYATGPIPFFEKVVRGLIFTNDDYMRLILKHIPDLNSPLSDGKTIIQTVWDGTIHFLNDRAFLKNIEEEDVAEQDELYLDPISNHKINIIRSKRLIELLVEEAERRNQ